MHDETNISTYSSPPPPAQGNNNLLSIPGWNVFLSNSYWSLIPSVTVFGQSLYVVIKSKWGQGWALIQQDWCPKEKGRDTKDSGTQRKAVWRQNTTPAGQGQRLRRNQTCPLPVLGFALATLAQLQKHLTWATYQVKRDLFLLLVLEVQVQDGVAPWVWVNGGEGISG
jgi:hypothetical protein